MTGWKCSNKKGVVVKLTHTLKCSKMLRTLSLCDNGISDNVADKLSAVITSNTYL